MGSRHTAEPRQAACTITTAMRMLNDLLDINDYAADKARGANLSHRSVGLMRLHHTSLELPPWFDR